MIELPVSLQAWQFAAACALGAALGLWYDLLRGVRRCCRRLTVPLDILFGLTLLVSLLLLGLYAGRGMLRLFLLPGVGLGALLWFLTLSKPFLRLWESVLRAFGRFFQKIRNFCKKIFSFSEKWVTILYGKIAARRRGKEGDPSCDRRDCPRCSS